ncbi:LuxR C-terminal-related transcriptional regulator [Parapedobacter sp.]
MHSLGNPIAIVYDDHRLFAETFAAVLEKLQLFKSVHLFADDEHAYRQFMVKHFDTPVYLFLDYYLPQNNALTLINETRRINKKTHIVVVSSITTPSLIAHILTYNPHGFISKSCGVDIVVECLSTISQGERYMCPVTREIAHSDPRVDEVPFTARELEMLRYFAQGLSVIDTANKTHLSKHTVVAHRRKMMTKAGVNSITELLAYARNKELI